MSERETTPPPETVPADDAATGTGGEGEAYRISIPVFSGPLDLLLHLVKTNEVEITEIPIATITDAFMEYLQAIEAFDMDQAGDFLLMASTLMEIKSRSLLPREEAAVDEEEIDPRSELIEQLLAYKRFKEASESLADRWDEQARRFGRAVPPLETGEDEEPEPIPPEMAADGIELWDLVRVFSRIVRETLGHLPESIRDTEIPVAVCMERILDAVRDRPEGVTLEDLWRPSEDRATLIGMFLATLELVRLKKVTVTQGGDAEIRLGPVTPEPNG